MVIVLRGCRIMLGVVVAVVLLAGVCLMLGGCMTFLGTCLNGAWIGIRATDQVGLSAVAQLSMVRRAVLFLDGIATVRLLVLIASVFVCFAGQNRIDFMLKSRVRKMPEKLV